MAAIRIANHIASPWHIQSIEYDPEAAGANVHMSSGTAIWVKGEEVGKVITAWQREVFPSSISIPTLTDITAAVLSLVPISEMVPIEEVKNVLRSVLIAGSYTE